MGRKMRKATLLNAGLVCLMASAVNGEALAKSRYRVASEPAYRGRGPIDVERRSWLDPGAKVPVGSTNRYMVQQTYLNQDPIQNYQPSWYGGETLPQRMPQNVIVPYDEGLPLDWP